MVVKRNGEKVPFDKKKIEEALRKAFKSVNVRYSKKVYNNVIDCFEGKETIKVEQIQDAIEKILALYGYNSVLKHFILYREKRTVVRNFVESKEQFINRYKNSGNTADATVDDNSNVSGKNIGILNNEIHKEDNIQISRGMVMRKLKEIYPDFDSKQYIRDLDSHIIYKHDESSFAGAIAPYCCSISMYPFLLDGIKGLGGLSAAPKNLDSFCGIYINLIFAVSSQFAGAVATSEFLLYFDYFARKEFGEDYFDRLDEVVRYRYKDGQREPITIGKQIEQHFQQVIYSINQPSAARGMQSAFVNFSYFDKPFFDGMFGDFYFPDGTRPVWTSLSKLQQKFMKWFNAERLKCILTFPVESFALVYQDGKFVDQESADFVAEQYAEGHSFFTYISDTVDSLSSCCRLRNSLTTKEFNFTNGNMGLETGSKSVITLNLNRIIQNAVNAWSEVCDTDSTTTKYQMDIVFFGGYLKAILDRVYKYHTAYNELLWDMYDAGLLPVYKSGFINLDKQYLTIGLNGLNEAVEFMACECSDNKVYEFWCQYIFGTIKRYNEEHRTKFNGHQLTYNTEMVPAESLSVKNYNWDKGDGYWVPETRNLYASYVFVPSKKQDVFERIRMHGSRFIGEFLDGGSAAHLNMSEHLTKKQYQQILGYAAEEGCQYLTFNVPNCECQDCGFIAKQPFDKCPKCKSQNMVLYDRVIGYLTKIPSWSEGRRIEQKTRDYSIIKENN